MAAKLMRAVQYDRYGGGGAALKLVEVSIPSPKKGQLLLKVEATSLNPADWKIQKGMLRPFLPPKFPFTPGTCVAGEVVEVGQGVTAFKAGDKVITLLHFTVAGGLAEYAAAEEKLTVHRPAGISAAEGSGIPIAGLTALHSLRSLGINLDGVDKPINVLVTAASGGIGHYAVQLLKLAGDVHVTATCGERNLELVKNLGADEVLDYKSPGGAALESPTGRKYDAVVNCVAGIPWSTLKANLAAGGKVADVAATAGDMLRAALQKVCFCNKRRFPLISTPDGPGLEFLVGQMMEGKLRTVVDSKFPLKRAAEGFDKSIEGHATGKIVVEIF
ncbi:unnamed protein product [Spirodela intermedia]|uniref:Enoyl reductase (ER) domain-containing protein n=1 Tax=Spirodela intermedia TaxID=51605 RepID=A0A7I8L619_SPIIN|nr:unnamed protein product [Spirodela intermedia]